MDIQALLKKKKSVKTSITKLRTKTEQDIGKLNNVGLLARKERFIELRTEVKDVLDSVISICKDEDEDDYCTEKDDLLDAIEAILVTIDTRLAPPVVNSQSDVQKQGLGETSVSSQSVDVKLPTLSLPLFSGEAEEWLAFSDLFEAAVSNNQTLTGAQKLQYLKGSLRSDALKIVNSLSITNENFEIAWKLLKDRYFNKREIVSSLMKRFINLTPLSGESSTQILKLIDSTKEFVRMLESLGYKLDPTTDTLVMHMILFKLDANSRTWFERTFSTDVIPKLDQLLQFLATQARSITSTPSKRNIQRKVTLVASSVQPQCPMCNGDGEHTLSKCGKFLNLSVQGRLDFVKSNNVCFNCLAQFHNVKTCKSKFRCKSCKKPHHSLLHIENASARERQGAVKNVSNSRGLSINAPVFLPAPIPVTKESSQNSGVVDVASCLSDVGPDTQVLLCTALIQVKDIWGNYQTCRCLLDSGSQASLVTNECIERLGLHKEKTNVRISCLGASDTRTNGLAEIEFRPHFPSQRSFHASVYVVSKIIGKLPHHNLDSSMCELFGDISLADPTFYKSGPIDVLLGVDLALPLLKGQTLSLGKDKPFAVRSDLGWVIGGRTNSGSQDSIHVNNIQIVSDDLINKFWELDSVPCAKPLTSLEKACEDHFAETHSRDENGRYTVRLPFHTPPTRLGDSRTNAIRRLTSVERHLISNPEKYELYRNFMKEYLELKHMELVPEAKLDDSNSSYLPHHGVLRDNSPTTKLRVVFDASSKTSSGLSLNDLLMVGPRVQPELFSILVQFRQFNVAICADVEKMFRQIKVHEEDIDWQRILWRDSPTEPIREYRLTTVTYGTSSAPFLSTRTLRQLAIDEQENYPAASRATLCHFYVDDLLSGSADKKGAIQLVSELQEMMKRGGFSLRKWVSNDPDVLSTIPEELKTVDSKYSISDDQPVKILGIAWLPDVDKFTFTITVNEDDRWTKRKVLAEVARIFDPLGWLAPTVIISKIFLQELWRHQLGWDEELPEVLDRQWRIFQEQLSLLTKIEIPRCILIPQAIEVQVHGFCDSSEKAYCAAIYIRSKDATQAVTSRLLTSKTRVSPVKPQSLPRLELCSALLLARLLQATLPTLTVPISETFAWSDSKITLAWLKSEPRRWLPFVANRVAQVQDLTPNVHWNFVSGLENPADCGTRGITPTKLQECDLWFSGPDWLRSSTFPNGGFEDNPQLQEDMSAEAKGKSKLIMLNTIDDSFMTELLQRFSSWNKLRRVVAYCLRFGKNCLLPEDKRSKSFLTTDEINTATKALVSSVQRSEFKRELNYLLKGIPLPNDSKLLPLGIFLDKDGIIRVGGRLKNSFLNENQKHQMLLPKNHHFTNILIEHFHKNQLHSGPQLTLSCIRQMFWIPSGRAVVRKILLKCSTCFRLKKHSTHQMMGDLPDSRFASGRAFMNVGVDFGGPFLTKPGLPRSKVKLKSYIALFVCFSTKAVHLEVVSELSTAAFLAALRRFVSRRGKPVSLYSDNGTNFRGASSYLKEQLRLLQSEDVQNFATEESISWHFIPPAAPHFGGLWEAGIKSMKQHLIKVCKSAILSFEELTTLVTQIEACLNSRPLTPLSSDPCDLEPLTPGHFLVGAPLTAVLEQEPTESISLRSRWALVQKMRNQFWRRWRNDYLHELQKRSKWTASQKNLEVGDMILLKDDSLPPTKWNLGRITDIFPGNDGHVRVVDVKTSSGLYRRPVTRCCPLPSTVPELSVQRGGEC